MMQMNKRIRPSVGADLSALGGYCDVRINKLKCISGLVRNNACICLILVRYLAWIDSVKLHAPLYGTMTGINGKGHEFIEKNSGTGEIRVEKHDVVLNWLCGKGWLDGPVLSP
jgi:hypothetical protein